MEKQEERKSSLLDGWNAPPNLVTFSRIILVIVFLVLYAKAGAWGLDNVTMRWVAAIIFIVAACTDKLDGWMARKYNQVTELGKLMDPIGRQAAHLWHADCRRHLQRIRQSGAGLGRDRPVPDP